MKLAQLVLFSVLLFISESSSLRYHMPSARDDSPRQARQWERAIPVEMRSSGAPGGTEDEGQRPRAMGSRNTDSAFNPIDPLRLNLSQQTPKPELNRFDPLLAFKLDSILEEDQKYRRMIGDIEAQHGWQSPEMKTLWKNIETSDSMNLLFVSVVLDKFGWLGPDIIGVSGNEALFLVIQHSPLETQVKYLPMMRNALIRGHCQASALALLEDRVALRQGKKQVYGTQISRNNEGTYLIMPIEDEVNVNKRRAEVGLPPLEEYALQWNIVYTPP